MTPNQRRKADARFAFIESELNVLHGEFKREEQGEIRELISNTRTRLRMARKAFKMELLEKVDAALEKDHAGS